MLVPALAIAGGAALGGLLPLFRRRSDRALHLLVALATGVFLGIVFLHLLPEAASAFQAHGTRVGGGLLIGVLGPYLLEKLAFSRRSDGDPHRAVGWGSLLALSLHALATGIGFAVAADRPGLEGAVLLSLVVHKLAEGFSLATVLQLAGHRRRSIALVVGLFALVTPAGLLLGSALLDDGGGSGAPLLTALAAGTFLYVALFDLLPESFHERRDTALKLLLLVAGVLATAGMHGLGL